MTTLLYEQSHSQRVYLILIGILFGIGFVMKQSVVMCMLYLTTNKPLAVVRGRGKRAWYTLFATPLP